MRPLTFAPLSRRGRLAILCLGAHCDDVDIGCGGALLSLIGRYTADVSWVIFSAQGERERELRASAKRFLRGAAASRILTRNHRDGFMPAHFAAVKEDFEAVKKQLPAPDVIFTHRRDDRHQDHRLIAELTWNTYRNHLILEYEVPKYEGDLATPSAYVALTPMEAERKIRILLDCYRTQRAKPWFTADTFRGLMRLRGIECGGPTGWAEGFHASKVLFG